MNLVYKATNRINNKAYIGWTKNLDDRKRRHKKRSKNNGGEVFHQAIDKYGWDNFEWEILYEGDDANLKEVELIAEHKTHYSQHGYNLTFGGEGTLGSKRSEESRQKSSISAKNRIVTPERLETLRNNAIKMRGVPRPEDVKRRISQSLSGKEFSESHLTNIRENNQNRDKSWMKTPEYKKKMSNSLSGQTRTPEQKERYRLAAIKRWESKEYRAKML